MLMKATKTAPVKQAISLDILNMVDIRVGTIELVEDIPGSEKLVGLQWISETTRDGYWLV